MLRSKIWETDDKDTTNLFSAMHYSKIGCQMVYSKGML